MCVLALLAQLVLGHFFLAGAFPGEPVVQPLSSANATGAIVSAQPTQTSSSADLDIYVLEPDNTPAKQTVAVTLFDSPGQQYRQGITMKGHWRLTEVAPGQYEIRVIAPGFGDAVQRVDATATGEARVDVKLRPLTSEQRTYPPPADPEVNYVFGLYA